jgi:hypothetical protein
MPEPGPPTARPSPFMSHVNKGVYAASCNPPRRAKRTRSDSSSPTAASPTQPRPLLPKQAALPLKPSGSNPSSSPTSESAASSAPGRRGRKPGLLSRSARDAQRRLNHSIIEKARRTKINNALATLKELVPPDYGRKAKTQEHLSEEEDETDNDDVDDDYGGDKKKSKAKPAGRKEEKEREYKLEILIRTVSYMQDLLQRVAELEQQGATVCPQCGTPPAENPLKQLDLGTKALTTFCAPGSSTDPSDADGRGGTKRARLDIRHPEPPELTATPPLSGSFGESAIMHRLPSISSWLPETLLDTSPFNSSPSRVDHQRNKEFISPLQLLTPPSSTHFNPATSASALAATSTSSSAPRLSDYMQQQKGLSPMLIRTPEDEHAATMLLRISSSGSSSNSSPVFRPLPPSIIPVTEAFSSMPSKLTSVVPQKNDINFPISPSNPKAMSIQTPASLLGLMTPIL